MADEINSKQRKMHPNSLANLQPARPGEVRNPKGPPKAKTQLYRYICEYLNKTPLALKRIDESKLTLVQRAALKTAIKIADGDWPRVKGIIERDEGKVAQRVEGEIADVIKFYYGVDAEKV